jgi:hypothetical protein
MLQMVDGWANSNPLSQKRYQRFCHLRCKP